MLFNFRKQELAKETSLDEVSNFIQNPLILKVLGLAATLAILLYINFWVVGALAEGDLAAARTELQKTFQETFPGVTSKTARTLTANPQQLTKYIVQKKNELNQKIKMMSKDHTPMLTGF